MGVIGFKEQNVSKSITNFNRVAKSISDEFDKNVENLYKQLAENWGAADAKQWFDNTCKPAMDKLRQSIVEDCLKIGKLIKSTGEFQAARSNNKINLPAVAQISLRKINGNMQDKLKDGFVGINSNFKSAVDAASSNLVSSFTSAITKMRNSVTQDLSEAFKDEEGGAVKKGMDSIIAELQSKVTQTMNSLNEDIATVTKNAEASVKNTQRSAVQASADVK